MGTEFPMICSRLPWRKGANKTPFNPEGTKGINDPSQFSNQPICWKKNPSHMPLNIKSGISKAFLCIAFFNMKQVLQ